MKIFSILFGGLVVVWIVWCFTTPNVDLRLMRACRPVDWTGNVVVSLTAFAGPTWEADVQHTFDRMDYMCRYVIWRLVYGQDWERTHHGQKPPEPAPEKKQDQSGGGK